MTDREALRDWEPANDFERTAKDILWNLKDNPDLDWLAEPPTTTAPFDPSDLENLPEPRLRRRLPPARDRGDISADARSIDAGRDALRVAGLDVLALYKSFRFRAKTPFPGHWGIFIFEQGVATVAAAFQDTAPSLPMHEAERLAFRTLLEHERFHFWVDAWALSMEDAIADPGYKRYEYYLAQMQAFKLTDHDYEESLANNHAFNRLRHVKLSNGGKAEPVLRDLFSACPAPYCNFDPPILDDQGTAISRTKMEGNLAGAVLNGHFMVGYWLMTKDPWARSVGRTLASTIQPGPTSYPLIDRGACPVYTIDDANFAARLQPFQGPPQREFQDFIEHYLAGELLRQTDHRFYRIDNGEEVKFPNPHDTHVRGYELKNVLGVAGMQHPEFVRERQRTKLWRKHCPRPEPKPPLR